MGEIVGVADVNIHVDGRAREHLDSVLEWGEDALREYGSVGWFFGGVVS